MTENTGEERERVRSRWSTLSRAKRLVLVLSLVFSAAAISLLIALQYKRARRLRQGSHCTCNKVFWSCL